ncbi:MAG: sulfurtransferase-like selenium metabolism protein YedF [Chloroflexi bacterium]|nr:sulfurtransferase-like selenium metabolism protein YedF [Chloroflexota bacterium]
MASLVIDARGLACPEPVLRTMKAMKEAEQLVTIVDNEAARENVSQLAKNEGWAVETEKRSDGVYLTLEKGPLAGPQETASTGKAVPGRGLVVMVASEFLGRGELPQLGGLLMQSFIHSLNGLLTKPETIVFINSGVKLVCRDSQALEDLRQLKETGIELLACGTCLSYFNLMDKVAVGQVSNMLTIADTLLTAERVVTV